MLNALEPVNIFVRNSAAYVLMSFISTTIL